MYGTVICTIAIGAGNTAWPAHNADTGAGTGTSGSGQTSPIGQITSVTLSNCTGPDGLVFTATTSASPSNPWPLNTSTYSSGVTHGTITNIQASISGAGCSATVAAPIPRAAPVTSATR